MESHRIFTIAGENAEISIGAKVEKSKLRNGVSIPVIKVGTGGGNKRQAIIPVSAWEDPIRYAAIGTTRTERKKLFYCGSATKKDSVIVVFRTEVGSYGGNTHTGDQIGWRCAKCGRKASDKKGMSIPEVCTRCESIIPFSKIRYLPFPGEILATGIIEKRGENGKSSIGEQIIALIPQGEVFRLSYFENPLTMVSYFFVWDGEEIIPLAR